MIGCVFYISMISNIKYLTYLPYELIKHCNNHCGGRNLYWTSYLKVILIYVSIETNVARYKFLQEDDKIHEYLEISL